MKGLSKRAKTRTKDILGKIIRLIFGLVVVLFLILVLVGIGTLQFAANFVALIALGVSVAAWLHSTRASWWPEFWQAVTQIDDDNDGKANAGWVYLEQVILEIPRMKGWDDWLRSGGVASVTAALEAVTQVLSAREETNHAGLTKSIKALQDVADRSEVSEGWKTFNGGDTRYLEEREKALERIHKVFSVPEEKEPSRIEKTEEPLEKTSSTQDQGSVR